MVVLLLNNFSIKVFGNSTSPQINGAWAPQAPMDTDFWDHESTLGCIGRDNLPAFTKSFFIHLLVQAAQASVKPLVNPVQLLIAISITGLRHELAFDMDDFLKRLEIGIQP